MERIKSFFNPGSVALIGATDREGAVGRIVLENLLVAKDKRKIYPINPGREKIFDMKCYPNIRSVPEPPDLAIVVIPAELVPDIVEESGRAGVKAISIISSGFKEIGEEGERREERIANIAKKYNIRIMGPNCMGVIRPSASLNTTFIRMIPKPGCVAFLSQSGALGAGILDWVTSRNLGLSAFVSLGSMMDVDFGDLIDYFGEDPKTRSIIIYPESIGNAKKFMSAARGFARTKPLIVLKPGKSQESIKAAMSHTGAIVGEDLYYDALFRRAGVVRVEEIKDLFNCASILNTTQLPKGPNLAIIANGGGPAVLATDNLISRGGKLAQLSEETLSALNGFLPANWSKSNPIDVLEDADPQRYLKAIEVTIKDPGVDGAVIIYTPQGRANSIEVAKAVIKQAKKSSKPILTALVGDREVAKAKRLFCKNNIPTYEFPEEAVRTYLYMYQYARNLEMLYETPEETPLGVGVPKNHLKMLIRKALREGRTLLSEEDSLKFLRTYGISSTDPCVDESINPCVTDSAEGAARIASDIGYPVVMKISSPDVVHKSDVGGVVLNISSADEVRKAFGGIMENVTKSRPDARIRGVSIHKMIANYDYEFIVGSKKDPIFGPVIMFGLGGLEVEFFRDIAVGLPPLNQVLARRLLEQTKIYEMLSKGFRSKPPVNLRLLDETLVRVSDLIIDFPEIKEIDINPLIVSGNAAIALDGRIILDEEAMQKEMPEYSHLVISPYPARYVQPWRCKDGRTVVLRPVNPEDELLERGLLESLSEESLNYRFFYRLKEITHDMLTRFCNIDYDREMAIVAEYTAGGKRSNVGVGRLFIQPGGEIAEFAVLVADDFQGYGLGLKLCDLLIGIARDKGLRSIYGIVLNENTKMINLANRLSFNIERLSSEESKVTLEL
ncbi:Peptidyl-lysine N-acetyltransferase Pat [subsurface metagenome]